jgi:hypothetical protein
VKNSRRSFLKTTATATAAVATVNLLPSSIAGKEGERGVAIILTPQNAAQKPLRWASEHFCEALNRAGATAQIFEALDQAPLEFQCVLTAMTSAKADHVVLQSARVSLPDAPEALGLMWCTVNNRRVLLACGSDVRGLVYAIVELADRVSLADNPIAELKDVKQTVERPANSVRSLARCFVSEVEDKTWFYDRAMWPRYLTNLASQRFNRFNLSLGIGYDFLQNVTDSYFLFAYPFLLSVPGHNVRVAELPDAERDRNLETLKYISEETVTRGLQFQLGIWMHGYKWLNSPNPNYTVSGLSEENHGAYCADAIATLLKACPAISGVTLRIHGESGVAEGNYGFWRTVFEGVAKCGRPVELDLHAKGIDQTMIDSALATGMPVNVAPKYWAEHLGMPYHQTEIRKLERPRPGKDGSGLMKLSSGSRSFLRYGYGDLLKEDRRYTVMHRIWPGTQRLLLWGDPMTGAAYGRAFSFCGSAGVEIMESLTFKGRRGSGIAGDRCGYTDSSLTPKWDWQKYLYTLRIWGRLLYNPDANAEVWQRSLRKQFGKGAKSVEVALAHASRILPIVTTAHAPSAANNNYWPEMYTNQSVVEASGRGPYDDTPSPKVFGNVSPLDPQLFLSVNDCARELLGEERSGRYSPIEVAQWIEDYAQLAASHLARAEREVVNKQTPEYRRMALDVQIQIGLGRFFGAKFRCGVLYALFEHTGDRAALAEAVKAYRFARSAWVEFANRARDAYRPDVTIGELPQLRGHWLDRLPAIDEDIARMEKKLEQPGRTGAPNAHLRACLEEALGKARRPVVNGRHVPPTPFRPGEQLSVDLALAAQPMAVQLHYRRVNQGERFETTEMAIKANQCHAIIPAAYTQSPYALQYYFQIKQITGNVLLYPGFAPDLANQPYFVVRQG